MSRATQAAWLTAGPAAGLSMANHRYYIHIYSYLKRYASLDLAAGYNWRSMLRTPTSCRLKIFLAVSSRVKISGSLIE